jgi:hypothetical protein
MCECADVQMCECVPHVRDADGEKLQAAGFRPLAF